MANFIQSVDEEIVEIERKIKPQLDRLEELRIARKIFSEKTESHPQPIRSMSNILQNVEMRIAKTESVAGRVAPMVADLLSDGNRRKVTELLEYVTKNGVEIGGKDKATGLSAILSRRNDLFSGDKKLGWTLVRFVKKEGESP